MSLLSLDQLIYNSWRQQRLYRSPLQRLTTSASNQQEYLCSLLKEKSLAKGQNQLLISPFLKKMLSLCSITSTCVLRNNWVETSSPWTRSLTIPWKVLLANMCWVTSTTSLTQRWETKCPRFPMLSEDLRLMLPSKLYVPEKTFPWPTKMAINTALNLCP